MGIVISVLGWLLIGGGFLWMMWGVIQILKEAYKDGPMWLIGCILIPVVLALFIVKNPERARAGRMTILKAMAPFVLGIVLLVAFASKKSAAAAKPEAKAPPVAAAPAPAPVPAAKAVPAAAPAPAPAAKAAAPAAKAAAPVAKTAAPAAAIPPVPVAAAAPAVDPNAGLPVLSAACRNEIGLYCASTRRTVKALKACLDEYSDNLLPECRAALRE